MIGSVVSTNGAEEIPRQLQSRPVVLGQVVSDECEPVSAATVALSVIPHRGRATRSERPCGWS